MLTPGTESCRDPATNFPRVKDLNQLNLPAAETFCLIDFASITLVAGIG